MDSENISIVRLLAYCASSATGVWMLSIMKLYHKNKALGMQTFLGRVVVLYLNFLLAVGSVTTITSLWQEVAMIGEQTATLLTVSSKIVNFCLSSFSWIYQTCPLVLYNDLTWVSATCIVLVVKYLSIYHSSYIHSLNEESAIKILRSFLLIMPPVLVSIEYSYLTGIKDTQVFHIYMGSKSASDHKMEVLSLAVYFITLITGLVLQTRIELDHLSYHEATCLSKFKNFFSTSNHNIDGEYKLSATRIIFAMGTLFIVFISYIILVGIENGKTIAIIYHVMFLTVSPTTFVLCHGTLRTIVTNQLQSCFMSTNTLISLYE